MSNKQLRTLMRWVHIIIGAMIAAFIYSPTLQSSGAYEAALQFVALPVVIISGVAMWQQARISKWRRRNDDRQQEAQA